MDWKPLHRREVNSEKMGSWRYASKTVWCKSSVRLNAFCLGNTTKANTECTKTHKDKASFGNLNKYEHITFQGDSLPTRTTSATGVVDEHCSFFRYHQ